MDIKNTEKKTVKFDKSKHIMYDEFCATTRVNEDIIKKWIELKILELIYTNAGWVITFESFHKLVQKPEYLEERNKSVIEITDVMLKDYENATMKLINIIRPYINKIELIHKEYKHHFDFDTQTPELAAYLLFAKVINLLHAIFDSFQERRLSYFMLFRPLNEAMQLAECFIVTKTNSDGKRKLSAWYLKNASPSMEIVRTGIDAYSKSLMPGALKDLFVTAKDSIHKMQSKSIHNTYNDIVKLFRYYRKNGDLLTTIEYDKTTNIIELNQHHQYLLLIIYSVYTNFQFVFEFLCNIIKPLDSEELNKYRKQINSNIDILRNSNKWQSL